MTYLRVFNYLHDCLDLAWALCEGPKKVDDDRYLQSVTVTVDLHPKQPPVAHSV